MEQNGYRSGKEENKKPFQQCDEQGNVYWTPWRVPLDVESNPKFEIDRAAWEISGDIVGRISL